MEVLNKKTNDDRNSIIIRTSIIGIIANVLLAVMKVIVGFFTKSIAIVLDGVNNITDAFSSIITIVGAKLVQKEPDKQHPFGYGRIEYLSATIIAILVMYAGITSLVESIKKIIKPETPSYDLVTLFLIIIAVLVKFFMGRYVKSVGVKVDSNSLKNSGDDAKLDSIISFSTLVAAIIFVLKKISIEPYIACIISVIIIKSSLEMLKETLSRILGERADVDLIKNIKKDILKHNEVKGVYDLILNDYGPTSYNGSIHIGVYDTMTADNIDKLIRKISDEIYHKYNCALSGISVYAINTKDDEAIKIREDIKKLVFETEYVLEMHGFYLDKSEKIIRFDVVISFDAENKNLVVESIYDKINNKYPDYKIHITVDRDFSSSV